VVFVDFTHEMMLFTYFNLSVQGL